MLDDNQGIARTLSPPDADGPVIYKVDGATDYYVNNPYEPDSDYTFMMSGVAPACQDCRGTSLNGWS